MKHPFISLLLVMLAVTIHAQQSAAAMPERNLFPARSLNEINIKAVRDFAHSFRQVLNVQWYKMKDGVAVHFTEAGIATRRYYDLNGNWLHNIRTYKEADLPKDIRRQIKTVYYDYSISNVNEITNTNNTVYLVLVEDNTCWKTIMANGDEMQITEEIYK